MRTIVPSSTRTVIFPFCGLQAVDWVRRGGMVRPVNKWVVYQNNNKWEADKDTEGPKDLSPKGFSIADEDKSMECGPLQELLGL